MNLLKDELPAPMLDILYEFQMGTGNEIKRYSKEYLNQLHEITYTLRQRGTKLEERYPNNIRLMINLDNLRLLETILIFTILFF